MLRLGNDCQRQRLAHLVDIVEGQVADIFGLDILDIALIVFAEDDIGDAGTLGSEDFLLEASADE